MLMSAPPAQLAMGKKRVAHFLPFEVFGNPGAETPGRIQTDGISGVCFDSQPNSFAIAPRGNAFWALLSTYSEQVQVRVRVTANRCKVQVTGHRYVIRLFRLQRWLNSGDAREAGAAYSRS